MAKILHVSSHSPRRSNRLALQVAQVVDANDVEVLVVLDDPAAGTSPAEAACKVRHVPERLLGVTQGGLSGLPRSLVKAGWLARDVLRARADVIHVHEHMLVWLAVLCSLVGRRVIWDPHDFFHEGFETGPLRWAVVKRVMERLLAVRDVPMLAVSEGMAAIYRSLYPRARIELVRNYAVEPRLTLHPRRPTADAAVLKVVYPGLLAPDRIPVEFIRAVGRQSGIQLDILGSDRWSGYGAGIRELIRAEHIGNVRLMGEYGSSGLLGTLSQYDWAVLPYVINHRNVDHCLPNKFFQCINAGLPLLVSSMTELGGLVAGHGLGHVFKDGDYTTAVALLQMYSPDSGEYEALRQRVFDYAAQQVDYEAQRMLLLSLYESVAAAPLSAGSTRPSLNP